MLYCHQFVYSLISISNKAQQNELFKTEFNLATPFTIFRSEVKRWLKHCEYETKLVDEQKQLRVDGKPGYQLSEPSDSYINALQMADPDSFPNIRTLLTIGCVFLQLVQLRLNVPLRAYDDLKCPIGLQSVIQGRVAWWLATCAR